MSSESKTLVPVEQKQVVFYEDEVTAVMVELAGKLEVYVPIRPICELLGVDWPSQYRRINRDPVLSSKLTGVVVTTTPDPITGGGSTLTAARPKPD